MLVDWFRQALFALIQEAIWRGLKIQSSEVAWPDGEVVFKIGVEDAAD